MPVGLRSAVVGALSPVAAAALALGSSLSASAAVPPVQTPDCSVTNKCTALLLGGTGTGTLTQTEMREALNGYFGNDNVYTRENVAYPGSWDFLPSIAIGASLLVGEITTTQGPIVVGGFSQGAAVANAAMYNLSINPKAPAKDQLRFVLVADPNHSPSASKWMVPETQYDVMAITQEYDGFADYPDRWWNPIATYNATLGGLYLHFATIDADLSTVPLENITVTVNSKGGVTTHYLVPTETLPLVKFLPFLAPLEPWLKEQVNAGYSRYDEVAPTSTAALRTVALDTELSDDEVEDPKAVEADADDSEGGDEAPTGNSVDGDDAEADAANAGDADDATQLAGDLDGSGDGSGTEGTDDGAEDQTEAADADTVDAADEGAVDADEDDSQPAHRLNSGTEKSNTVGGIQQRVSSEAASESTDTDSAESADSGSADSEGGDAE